MSAPDDATVYCDTCGMMTTADKLSQVELPSFTFYVCGICHNLLANGEILVV